MSTKSEFTSLDKFVSSWDFKTNAVFIGAFIERKTIDNPKAKDNEKKSFDVFEMIEEESGIVYNIPCTHQIESAMNEVDPDRKLFRIEYKGKKNLGGGKTVNTYYIGYKIIE
jgi:hypothetical protein